MLGQASISGKGTSGVKRVIGPSPSKPLPVSSSTKLPAVFPWWAEAVKTILFELGIVRASNMQCGLGV